MRPLVAVLLAVPLLGGCFPHYRGDPGLERERGEALRLEREQPGDPRHPQARYAICLRMAEGLVAPSEPALPLSGGLRSRGPEGSAGACCLGGLAFAADILVVAPLRALRTVFTVPVAWVRRAALRREAEEARLRWLALDPAAGRAP